MYEFRLPKHKFVVFFFFIEEMNELDLFDTQLNKYQIKDTKALNNLIHLRIYIADVVVVVAVD